MNSRQVFQGIRAIDFSWAFSTPYAARYLADHGAEVIKVESRQRPDFARIMPPFKDNVPDINHSGGFGLTSSSKHSVGLNLRNPRGCELAKKLVAVSDAVFSSFTPGTMERLGLGYEELKKVKPDIIVLSSSVQGQTGPHAFSAGYGFGLTAQGGFFDFTGWPNGGPTAISTPYTDFIANHFAAIAVIAALDYRRRTGKGQHIDLSQYESGLQCLEAMLLDYSVNGRQPVRNGNRHPSACPHGVFRCQGEDRWCVIAVFDDQEWQAFCQVIGEPAWTKEPRFATLLKRKENEDELDRLVEEWTVNYPPEQVMALMQAAGVTAGLVEDNRDFFNDPQLEHRRFFTKLEHPEMGSHAYEAHSFILSKTPAEMRPAPLFGQHNDYVFKEILGIPEEEYAQLVVDGVVEY